MLFVTEHPHNLGRPTRKSVVAYVLTKCCVQAPGAWRIRMRLLVVSPVVIDQRCRRYRLSRGCTESETLTSSECLTNARWGAVWQRFHNPVTRLTLTMCCGDGCRHRAGVRVIILWSVTLADVHRGSQCSNDGACDSEHTVGRRNDDHRGSGRHPTAPTVPATRGRGRGRSLWASTRVLTLRASADQMLPQHRHDDV
jgi:hypothetical protein